MFPVCLWQVCTCVHWTIPWWVPCYWHCWQKYWRKINVRFCIKTRFPLVRNRFLSDQDCVCVSQWECKYKCDRKSWGGRGVVRVEAGLVKATPTSQVNLDRDRDRVIAFYNLSWHVLQTLFSSSVRLNFIFRHCCKAETWSTSLERNPSSSGWHHIVWF